MKPIYLKVRTTEKENTELQSLAISKGIAAINGKLEHIDPASAFVLFAHHHRGKLGGYWAIINMEENYEVPKPGKLFRVTVSGEKFFKLQEGKELSFAKAKEIISNL
jgi:hypothetical protein